MSFYCWSKIVQKQISLKKLIRFNFNWKFRIFNYGKKLMKFNSDGKLIKLKKVIKFNLTYK